MGTIEFALCFPVLLLLYFSAFAYWSAHRAQQSLNTAAVTAVDLASRSYVLDEDGAARIVDIALSLTRGRAANNSLQIVLVSVSNPTGGDDQNSDIDLDWVVSNSLSLTLKKKDLDDLPLPMIAPGDSVIFAEVAMEHTLPFVPASIATLTFAERAVRRPRFVNRVEFDDQHFSRRSELFDASPRLAMCHHPPGGGKTNVGSVKVHRRDADPADPQRSGRGG